MLKLKKNLSEAFIRLGSDAGSLGNWFKTFQDAHLNVGNQLPSHEASHPRRMDPSTTRLLLFDCQILNANNKVFG
jgi:hypothetical protein